MTNLLLIEDDVEICEILQFYLLSNSEYNLFIVHNAEQALQLFGVRSFDLVLADINLPGMDGIEFCAKLRENSFCPLIFISCINDDETIIRALESGGDDYIVKPFSESVLMARIKANLRRHKLVGQTGSSSEDILTAGDLELDANSMSVNKKGEKITLSPKEYEILFYFMSNKNQFVTFDELYQAVWQRPSLGDFRALFVHIAHLRHKVEDDPSKPTYIRTHMRDGYIFSDK